MDDLNYAMTYLMRHNAISVKEGDAYGLLQAIKWVAKLGFNDVIFELDAKVVVDFFNKPTVDFTYFGFIIIALL